MKGKRVIAAILLDRILRNPMYCGKTVAGKSRTIGPATKKMIWIPKEKYIVTMMISGGLAGFGAGIFYLSGIEQWMVQQTSVPGMGFNGIAAAFLGGLDPIGTIFASYFIQHITSGGTYVDTTTYCTQISDLISAFIIYLCAFVFFFKIWFNRYLDKKEEKSVKVKKGGRK